MLIPQYLSSNPGRGEPFDVTAGEMPFILQFSAYLVEARNNVLRECEGVAGFRNTYSPEVSGPFVYILKNVVVDRLKMTRIEPALYRLVFQFNRPTAGHERFEFV